MDVITFEIGDTTIQLVNGDVLFWTNGTDHEPDVVVTIDRLQDALSAARMLRKTHEA
jgi:hypothetical protein